MASPSFIDSSPSIVAFVAIGKGAAFFLATALWSSPFKIWNSPLLAPKSRGLAWKGAFGRSLGAASPTWQTPSATVFVFWNSGAEATTSSPA